MTSYVRPACLALAFVATAVPASAQTWFYEPDVPRARVYLTALRAALLLRARGLPTADLRVARL